MKEYCIQSKYNIRNVEFVIIIFIVSIFYPLLFSSFFFLFFLLSLSLSLSQKKKKAIEGFLNLIENEGVLYPIYV